MTRWLVLAAAAAFALSASPASAQEPPLVDVGVGFTMQAPPDVNMPPLCQQLSLYCSGSGRTFPDFGIGVSAAGKLLGPLFVVGDVNVWGNNWRVDGTPAGQRVNQVLAGLVGLRYRARDVTSRRDGSSASFFGQFLIGSQVAAEVPGRRVLQPGGGMDVRIRNTGLSFRIELDYTYSPGPGRNLTTSRGFMGIVMSRGTS